MPLRHVLMLIQLDRRGEDKGARWDLGVKHTCSHKSVLLPTFLHDRSFGREDDSNLECNYVLSDGLSPSHSVSL